MNIKMMIAEKEEKRMEKQLEAINGKKKRGRKAKASDKKKKEVKVDPTREFTAQSLLGSQEVKADAGKPQLSLVPAFKTLEAVARIREYGCKKYKDKDNWKKVEIQRYKDAMMRHWFKYLEDPKAIDSESGLPHLHHAACNLFFIIELEEGNA